MSPVITRTILIKKDKTMSNFLSGLWDSISSVPRMINSWWNRPSPPPNGYYPFVEEGNNKWLNQYQPAADLWPFQKPQQPPNGYYPLPNMPPQPSPFAEEPAQPGPSFTQRIANWWNGPQKPPRPRYAQGIEEMFSPSPVPLPNFIPAPRRPTTQPDLLDFSLYDDASRNQGGKWRPDPNYQAPEPEAGWFERDYGDEPGPMNFKIRQASDQRQAPPQDYNRWQFELPGQRPNPSPQPYRPHPFEPRWGQ